MKSIQIFFFILSLILWTIETRSTHAETITGTIDTVLDGDLITMVSKGKEIEVRLFGIDTPDRNQAYCQNAKNFTGAMVSGKDIRAEQITKDQNGRPVAIVFVNGVNLNEQIVSQGLGWVHPQDCKESVCANWLKLEANAKASRKGLWADARPIPPWEYRRNQAVVNENMVLASVAPPPTNTRIAAANPAAAPATNVKMASASPAAAPATNAKINPASPVAAPAASAKIAPTAPATYPTTTAIKITPTGPAPYHGDTGSRLFHSDACKEFTCRQCTVNLYSVTEALDAGYRPHRDCITK